MSAASRKRQINTTPSVQLLFDESPEPMMVVDAETLGFLEVNRATIQKYGFSREEFRNMRFPDLVPPEHRNRLADAIQSDRFEPGAFCDMRHVLKNGQSVEVDMLVHHIRYAQRQGGDAGSRVGHRCHHRCYAHGHAGA